MYGFIEGFSDTSEINYCPKCGEPAGCGFADGTCERVTVNSAEDIHVTFKFESGFERLMEVMEDA